MSNLNVNYANRPGVAIDIVRNINQPNDVITLNALVRENASDDNNSRSTAATAAAAAVNSATPQPTTPIPGKKLNNKWLTNLSLQISKTKYADQVETANAALSNVTLTTDTAGAANIESSRDVETATNSSSAGTTFPYEYQKTVKRLDISFDNVKFAVTTGFFKREHKQILNGLTGKFRAGELSAIVGPSGAGKSTLLNFLSSYTPYGYTGDIMVNDKLRNTTAFKPNVAFITQDTSLQPFLRVKEAMHFAANLKIGSHMTKNQKRERVRTILKAIGMYDNRHTITGNLSGGQKKRLAIALELVNNPPVLILDEPTSGLDSSISNQCISLLKKLALEGRAIICTIHQPSALSFEMFDHLYAIAEGRCIYAGATQNLVPFLAEIDLHCPKSYNPADFLMEIATNDYGPLNDKLVEKIENGRNNTYRHNLSTRKTQMEAMRRVDKMSEGGLMTPVTAPVLSLGLAKTPNHRQQQEQQQQQEGKPLQFKQVPEMSSRVWDSCGILSSNETEHNIWEAQPQLPSPVDNTCCKPKKPNLQIDPGNLCKRENIYASPFYRQLGILLVRTFLILWRDSSLATMRCVIHFVIAVLIGLLYYGIGNDASNALNNFRYTFYTIMFIMYCAFSSILVKFPLEFPIVSREHFNRWYSLRAYYIAITLADIPIQLICTSLFIFTTYLLTGQPWELLRIALFSFIVFLTALVGQSIGLAVGASLSVQLGAILGPFFILPFLAFSGFFLQRKDSPVYLTWMFDISFLKYSLDGAMLALFGYDRAKLECTSMYCHYSRPTFFLKDLDMTDANYELAAVFLLLLFLGLRIIAFYIMSFRLRLFR